MCAFKESEYWEGDRRSSLEQLTYWLEEDPGGCVLNAKLHLLCGSSGLMFSYWADPALGCSNIHNCFPLSV